MDGIETPKGKFRVVVLDTLTLESHSYERDSIEDARAEAQKWKKERTIECYIYDDSKKVFDGFSNPTKE